MNNRLAAMRWLTEPRGTLPEPERRRARLLAWLLLSLLVLVGVALVFVFLFNPTDSYRRDTYALLIVGLTVPLTLAYGLNHAGYYKASARLTVLLSVLGPWGSVVIDPTIQKGDFIPLAYIALSILLCSMLLPARTTLVVATFHLTGLTLVLVSVSATTAINAPSLLAFVLFTALLSVVANVVRRQDWEQIDRQTRQLSENAEQLREQSVRDPLTGLFNRRYLVETLERELRRGERNQHPLGIIMLDVDGLKGINDTLGHAAGDVLLRQVADLMRRHVRDSDVACRHGGDEFLLILPDACREVTLARAEHLCAEARGIEFHAADSVPRTISLSLGVAVFPDHGSTSEALLQAADLAMYRAKRAGRNRVVTAK